MYGRNVATQVIKAREVEVSFVINETDRDDVMNLARLREEGARDFGGQTVTLQLTDYLTVHNVIAVEDIQFVPVKQNRIGYLDGSSNPRKSTVTVKLIIDNARAAKPVEERLIEAEAVQLNAPVKALR